MNKINKIIIILISFLFISCNVPNPPEPLEYKINYDLDGGLCNDLALEFKHDEIVILPTPVKEGFTFIGWIDADTNEVVTEITNKDYHLIAKWEKKVYKLEYNLDGGLCDELQFEFVYDEIVILPTPVKEGFTFIGWIDADTDEIVTEITNKDYNLIAKWEEIEIYNLVIECLPVKTIFYNDEDLVFDGLTIYLQSDKNKYLIEDYSLNYVYEQNVNLGILCINVTYEKYFTSFEIELVKREKESLLDHLNYIDKTIQTIEYVNHKEEIKEIKFSSSRGANEIIAFTENNLVKTNIYGYEILINEYGQIIDKNVNVTIDKNCMIISAHGNRAKELKSLNVGDYTLLFNGVLYVYDGANVSKANDVFLMFNNLISSIELVEDIKVYNDIIYKLNEIIPLLDELYNNYTNDTHKEVKEKLDSIVLPLENLDEHTHNYTYNEDIYNIHSNQITTPNMFLFYTKYNDVLHYGGFRNTNQIHYYDESNFRTRNAFGYEVAVNKEGIVVDKDILVELPEGGFIISGHGDGNSFIVNNINLFDKIILTDNTFEVHRDNMYMMTNTIYSLVNELILTINDEKEREVPHDYEFIDKIIKRIDSSINNLNIKNQSLLSVRNIQNEFDLIKHNVALCYGQLLDYSQAKTRGIWYYPFRKAYVFDDTSLEGVMKTLNTLKEMGINEIVINPFNGSYALFENSIYSLSSVLETCDYGEYGQDFLMCFIEEAHKLGIKVNAFTQTFANNSASFINKENGYYQIDFEGNKSLGSIYYYDICNDELQEVLLTWYKELITKYDFDKIEYDIIRYPSSNLYKYLDVEVISDDVIITDHGYTEYSMNKFMSMYGLSGDLRTIIRNSKEVRINWLKFKEDELVSFITKCTSLLKSIRPDVKITAAVLNDYDGAKKSYLQDAKKWLELGIVDEIEPMAYTISCEKVSERIEFYNTLIPDYNFRMGISPRLTTRDIIIDIKQLKLSLDCNGYILFANNLYNDNEFINILKASYNNNESIYDELIDKIEGYYSIKDNNSYIDLVSALKMENIELFRNLVNDLNNENMKAYLLKILNSK